MKDPSPERRLPHFVLAGAMKCGTTTLHRYLERHPDVFIPRPEIAFYDIDDLRQHPDFHIFDRGRWYVPRIDGERERYLDWYATFFAEAGSDQILGEDSTTYISSTHGMRRLREINPGARILVLFRDPASRSYSHYWHLLRSGRALYSFEESLQVMQETIVQRSLYREAVTRVLEHFPREQVHFELFERLVDDLPAAVERAVEFIGAEPGRIDFSDDGTNYNPALLPLSTGLQRLRNRALRLKAREIYLQHLPETPSGRLASWPARALDRIHSLVNPLVERRPPPMSDATREFLDEWLQRENDGLSELIGLDTESYWYRSRRAAS